MFNRSEILRDAHVQTRKRITWGRDVRPYRVVFAFCLRECWRFAKLDLAETAWEAAHPVPAAVLEQANAMRAAAWGEPITAAGNAAYRARLLQADALVSRYRHAA